MAIASPALKAQNVPKAKNYVLVLPDGKTEVRGLFRKRNRYPLEREFPIELVKRYFLKSPEAAADYYRQVRASLLNRTMDIKRLMVTRKISKTERQLVELELGQPGEVVSFYQTEKDVTGEAKYLPSLEGDYSIDYYRKRLDGQCRGNS